MKKNEVNKSGFTLIEILIVVLIIGLLTSIALPGYRKAVEKSKASEALSNLSALSKSEHSFYLAKNKYTKEFADLDIQLQGTMDEEVLKTDYYDYELLDSGILVSRNNGAYTLYRDFETSQIMCAPNTHYICDNLAGFTKVPCQNAELFWADTDSTCYADPESRCNAYGTNLWHKDNDNSENNWCGYTNSNNKTLNDGMECKGEAVEGCRYSKINSGGVCVASAYLGCRDSIINNGGTCQGTGRDACYASTVTAGGVCKGVCLKATINNGGECQVEQGTSNFCTGLIINTGGKCTGVNSAYASCVDANVNGGICDVTGGHFEACYRANVHNNGVCSGSCNYSTVYDGGVCSGQCQHAKINNGGICSGACEYAEINTGGICKSSESNYCNKLTGGYHVTYNGGCCCGNYCGDAPKCKDMNISCEGI